MNDSSVKLDLVGNYFSPVVANLFDVCHEFAQHAFKRKTSEVQDLVGNLVKLGRLPCDFETISRF